MFGSSPKRNKSKREEYSGGSGEVAAAMQDDGEFKKCMSVIDQIKRFYDRRIKPLESTYWFNDFHPVPFLTPAYFEANPMVLLLGQYSVGKTSFIRYLLERDHKGLRVGPEPTTDRFVAVLHGQNDRILPGNAAAVDAEKPFAGLEKYGVDFLNKFQCIEMQSEILTKITLVDTPGVLAGAKQVENRGYDMSKITEWFADRSDRILVLFDAHKLDISDEMKSVIRSLKANHTKVRIVMNKADSITSKQLMRVYGAMMWSLGRVIDSPESLRVYVGSFWEKPMKKRQFHRFMLEERKELLDDLRELPRHSTLRKINQLVRRCRYFKVHLTILRTLRFQLQYVMFKEAKQKELMKNLFIEFKNISAQNGIPPKDFPDINKFRSKMEAHQIWRLPKLPQIDSDIEDLNRMLSREIPNIMRQLPLEEKERYPDSPKPSMPNVPPPHMRGKQNPLSQESEKESKKERKKRENDKKKKGKKPKAGMKEEKGGGESVETSPREFFSPPTESQPKQMSLGLASSPAAMQKQDDQDFDDPFTEVPKKQTPSTIPWVVKEAMYTKCQNLFNTLGPVDGKITGKQCKDMFVKSGLSMEQLKKIWFVSDIDKDKRLDVDEFTVALYLIDSLRRKRMSEVPPVLPADVIPPSKRM
ncbi:hypothetical protein AAMO2058_001506200 [Amorphochlora amoebiformis]